MSRAFNSPAAAVPLLAPWQTAGGLFCRQEQLHGTPLHTHTHTHTQTHTHVQHTHMQTHTITHMQTHTQSHTCKHTHTHSRYSHIHTAAAATAVQMWRPDGLLVAFPVMAYSFTAHPWYLGVFTNMQAPSVRRMTSVTDAVRHAFLVFTAGIT